MSIWANSLSVLVITNECLSNCFIYDQECCYRHYGAENVDWQSLAFTLWPTELPLGFLHPPLLTKKRVGWPRQSCFLCFWPVAGWWLAGGPV